MADLQYPIGRFSFPDSATAEQRQAWIREIARTPQELRAAVAGLSAQQLDTPYRPGGWTVRQVADTTLPIAPSLDLLEALHFRWVRLLESMSDRDYERKFVHPESGALTLNQWLAQYAWHGRHHVAHITSLRKKPDA
jgi:hypothetical protein